MIVPCFTKEHIFNNVVFREIPGYTSVAVSENGEVIRLDRYGNPSHILGQYKFHNTKTERRDDTTYYLNVKLIGESDKPLTTAVHILVCTAWNGQPPRNGKRYDVNHKNSIKTDNKASNLEWTTRAKNITHCFDEGNNCAAVRIIAKNIETGEEIIFRSIKNFAEKLGIHRVNARSFITRHSVIPHEGFIYKLEEPRNFRFEAKKYQSKQVAFKDYNTNKISFVKSIEDASALTGVLSSTVKHCCDRLRDKGKIRPIKQYFFQYLQADMKWPEFTKDELQKYEESFIRRSLAASNTRK